MSNPSMPNIPGMGAMSDTLDFVKNLWGGMGIPGMNIPGMVMPTLSVDEINKQISDLKAVESWLSLNMNMLRNTIQALEVQSATISTLQSMSETLSKAVNPGGGKTGEKASEPAARRESAYSFTKTAEKSHNKPADDEPADDEQMDDEPMEDQPAEAARPKPASGKTAAAGESATAGMANPAIWWNMLQDQFKQAVNTAMASEMPTAAPKAAPKAATKAAPKAAVASKPAAKKKTALRKRAAQQAGEK